MGRSSCTYHGDPGGWIRWRPSRRLMWAHHCKPLLEGLPDPHAPQIRPPAPELFRQAGFLYLPSTLRRTSAPGGLVGAKHPIENLIPTAQLMHSKRRLSHGVKCGGVTGWRGCGTCPVIHQPVATAFVIAARQDRPKKSTVKPQSAKVYTSTSRRDSPDDVRRAAIWCLLPTGEAAPSITFQGPGAGREDLRA